MGTGVYGGYGYCTGFPLASFISAAKIKQYINIKYEGAEICFLRHKTHTSQADNNTATDNTQVMQMSPVAVYDLPVLPSLALPRVARNSAVTETTLRGLRFLLPFRNCHVLA